MDELEVMTGDRRYGSKPAPEGEIQWKSVFGFTLNPSSFPPPERLAVGVTTHRVVVGIEDGPTFEFPNEKILGVDWVTDPIGQPRTDTGELFAILTVRFENPPEKRPLRKPVVTTGQFDCMIGPDQPGAALFAKIREQVAATKAWERHAR